MANETKYFYGTPTTLEASGASATDGSFVQADDATFATADHADYPDAKFVLTCTFATAPTTGKVVGLYVREMNIDGTLDAPTPDPNYPHEFVENFKLDNVNTSQTIPCYAYGVPKEGQYYLKNEAGQTMSAGWTLKVTPMTVGPA